MPVDKLVLVHGNLSSGGCGGGQVAQDKLTIPAAMETQRAGREAQDKAGASLSASAAALARIDRREVDFQKERPSRRSLAVPPHYSGAIGGQTCAQQTKSMHMLPSCTILLCQSSSSENHIFKMCQASLWVCHQNPRKSQAGARPEDARRCTSSLLRLAAAKETQRRLPVPFLSTPERPDSPTPPSHLAAKRGSSQTDLLAAW